MSYRKYDHNVDIKSTQISKGLANVGKLLLIIASGALTLFVGAVITAAVIGINQHNKDIASKEKAIDISSFQIQKRIDDDRVNNPPRFDLNWSGKWVKFRGEVWKISDYTFYVSNQSHKWGSRIWANVICDYKSDQKGRVAQLNKGTRVKIVGKLSVSKPFDTVNFKLYDCEVL